MDKRPDLAGAEATRADEVIGGLRETAWHSKPETLENAAPQADEAEAQF
jgi:hypothetical protein